MERFAIKIDKSVKARLKNLCRLCGIDNPNQIDILNAAEWIDLTIDGEQVTLGKKIADCVGIQVTKTDRMPQRVCSLCVDKINDFYEFREMCHATNDQTRKLLNLPDPAKVKPPKKVTIKEEEGIESIFGIVDADVKPKTNKSQKSTKKSKKNQISSTVTSANESRFRGMTKREIEITLELERIKKEEEEEQSLLTEITPTNRAKNVKKKKTNSKLASDALLLAPKEPNQRERKREIEQKRIEKKRKPEVKIKAPVVKKIKKEPGVACLLCEERFEKNSFRDAHLSTHHRPLLSEYGCSSCHEQFTTIEENTSHHEWHSMFNIPHKCLMCDATFEKLITFQRHLSACAHPSYVSNVQFSKSFYCDLCSTDFETQNLYDWHDCLIGNNSPCPTCQRVFIKKTVLMKHIFKCTGPPGQSTDMAPKKVGRPKKKNALNMDKSDIPPQNSIKFEPETIIEQNMDADDGFEAMDNSFMDSHFGDSDNEFDANDSIIAPTQPDINAETTIGTSGLQPSVSSTSDSTTTTTNLSTNLHQPLLECRVKLEPLDVSAFENVAQPNLTEPNVEATVPPLVVSRPTVPPLTIRIKKEVIHPGYGDEFDANLARNIKQEKSDGIWELANTSREHKKSKNRDKQKKLYKKPALLAIKIKQERMEREDTYDEQYNDMYDSFSMSSSNMSEMTENPTYETNSLPIITQIHSVIETSSINPLIDEVTNQRQTTIIPQVSNQPMTSIPFVPIRIKSEFQKSLFHPPTETSECLSNVNDTATISSMEVDANHAEIGDAIENENPNQNEGSQTNECDVNISPRECNNLQPMECQDASESNIEIKSSNDISADDKSAENVSIVNEEEKHVAQQNTSGNEPDQPPTMDNESNDDTKVQNEISSEYLDIIQPLVIVKCQEIEAQINEAIVDSSIEINQHVTTTTFSDHSMEEVARGNNLEQTSNENDKNRQIMEVIKPMCDATENIDADVPNVSASISPIDFNEANDDSLNFIDQLVHEVADTMIPQVSNENENKEAQTEIMPSNSTDMQFSTENFSFNVGCSSELVENEDESRIESSEATMDDISAADIIEEITKDSASESLLALSDISDIDYNDLLPVLDATESKSNGTDVMANLPALGDPSDIDGSINRIEPNLLDETEQPKLLHDNSNQQPNCSSNTSNESL